MWIIALPYRLFTEIVYLIRHPWIFNWIATTTFLFFVGLGFIFTRNPKTQPFVVITWVVGFMAYYVLKINLNRRKPKVRKRHYKHYRDGIHTHKRSK